MRWACFVVYATAGKRILTSKTSPTCCTTRATTTTTTNRNLRTTLSFINSPIIYHILGLRGPTLVHCQQPGGNKASLFDSVGSNSRFRKGGPFKVFGFHVDLQSTPPLPIHKREILCELSPKATLCCDRRTSVVAAAMMMMMMTIVCHYPSASPYLSVLADSRLAN